MSRPAGASPVRSTPDPGRSVASLATTTATSPAIRRQANTRAETEELRNVTDSGRRAIQAPAKAATTRPNEREGRVVSRGVADLGTRTRTIQKPGRPCLSFVKPPVRWGPGDQLSNADAFACTRVVGQEPVHAAKVDVREGRPQRVVDGDQGVGGPRTSDDVGERLALGPDRAKAARVVTNLWRES